MSANNLKGLSLPQSREHKCLNLEFSKEAVNNYCQTLPTHDLAESTKQIFSILNCSNHHSLDGQLRLDILELLRPRIDYTCDILFKHYLDHVPHDPIATKKISMLSEKLLNELADGYKLSIYHSLTQFFLNKKVLLTCISQILRINIHLFLIHFLFYSSTPKNLWLECHTLYRLAEDKKLHKKTLVVSDKTLAHKTIEDWYKHCVILTLANPYRLRPQELMLLHHAIPYWTSFVNIITEEYITDELFIMDLSRDTPPVYAALNIIPPSTDTRVLELKKLNYHLEKLINSIESGSSTLLQKNLTAENMLPAQLVKQLLASWTYFAKRSQDRVETCLDANIYIGINAIFDLINKQIDEKEKINCKILNESPGGYCAECDTNLPRLLQTGEIIAIELSSLEPNTLSTEPSRPFNEKRISLGTIRWVKQLGGGKAQFGVQLIGHQPKAVLVHTKESKAPEISNPAPQKLLLLPEMPIFGRPLSLIAPTLLFKSGQTVDIRLSDNKELNNVEIGIPETALLSTIIQSTSSFKQFQIQEN